MAKHNTLPPQVRRIKVGDDLEMIRDVQLRPELKLTKRRKMHVLHKDWSGFLIVALHGPVRAANRRFNQALTSPYNGFKWCLKIHESDILSHCRRIKV